MQETYSVKFENAIVGQVEIVRKGMFYKISCHCRLPNIGRYRLYLNNETSVFDLGVLIPNTGDYTLVTSIPMHRFGSTDVIFTVRSAQQVEMGVFVPVDSTKPFSLLAHLEHACYQAQNNMVGIWIPRYYSNDSSKPTGQ